MSIGEILDKISFKDLVENSNDMVWLLNMSNMHIEYVNKTTLNEMGYTLEEMQELGMGKLRKSLPDAISFSEHIKELKSTDSGMTDYAILVRKDSSEFYIEVKAQIVDINGAQYNLAIVRDITERVEMLQALEQEAKKTQNYLEISKVLIMALDNDKNIVMINQAGAELLGYERDELIGKNFVKICIPPNNQENINKIANDVIKAKSNHTGNINEIITKNGDIKLVSWKNSTMLDENGETIGILTSGEDITELTQTQKQLLLHTKEAQMGEMINMIAHQWRQPLSSISSLVMNLQLREELEDYDKEVYFKGFQNIANTVQHLSKTIDDFRSFFKEDKRTSKLQIDQLIESGINLVKPALIYNDISLNVEHLCSDEITIYKNEFTQVLVNILKNSQEVLQERKIHKPEITIKTFKVNENYKVSISDNAGGIDPQIIDKVFDPYFTTKSELNGTGLGLYMSKTIIKEHCKGDISVVNSSAGAIFTISLKVSVND